LRTAVLVGLLILAVIAALYLAKSLLIPVVSAFVIGTMLSPAATWMQRFRIPRPLAAVLIVLGTFGALVLMIGLISAPLLEWTSRLPELAALIRARATAFERPLAFFNEVSSYFGAGGDTTLQWPKIEWVQPTLEFLSPTLAELLLFFATLVLFLASWRDLRRALVLTFSEHENRLRALRILNEIEESLGGYLLTVTLINIGVGTCTGIVCAITHMPNPVGLGALAAVLNFIPIIGPIATFIVLLAVGVISFPDVLAGLAPALAFAGIAFLEGHFVTPAIIGRRLALNALAVFVAIAFWT
jgi:predicted PurR-regulated permease PerM